MFARNRTDAAKEYIRQYHQRPDVMARTKERSEQPQAKKRRAEYAKAYYRRPENKDRARHYAHARRDASGSFTAADIESIRIAQGNRCYLCGKKLKKYHIDHFIPISKGGTNDPGNLRIACPKCNLSKGAKHPHDIGLLI